MNASYLKPLLADHVFYLRLTQLTEKSCYVENPLIHANAETNPTLLGRGSSLEWLMQVVPCYYLCNFVV